MSRKKNILDNDERMFSILNLTKITLPVCFSAFFIAWVLGSISGVNLKDTKHDVLVESLITRDKDILSNCETVSDIKDRFGRTTLHSASYAREIKRRYNPIPVLLKKDAEINATDFVGRTPLFYSVRKGNFADIKILVQAGADLNISDNYGHTPTHVAAIKSGLKNQESSKKYLAILRFLKENGADLKIKDYKGRTPLDCLNHFSAHSI
tara:strand:- start:34 stop:660 length:627 start_codon:yes stop_codon:yes gene_type:complete